MKILMVDVGNNLLDFSLRCLRAGHEVRVAPTPDKEGNRPKMGNGLVEKVSDWRQHMKWADLIVVPDNTKYMRELETFHKAGYPIWGPRAGVADWELNRMLGQEVMGKAGLPVMDCVEFKTVKQAKEFLVANPDRWVSKPAGYGDTAKALSYVSKSARDMMFMLERWESEKAFKGDPFIFQPFFKGIEVAVGGWMGRNGFLEGSWCENFEHKKLMVGEVGVNTGEMGTVVKYVKESALASVLLKPLEATLIRMGYVGYIDVAVMINDKGKMCPLEFTCRPGWPLFQIQQTLHKGDPAQWMADALEGRNTFEARDEVATGVVVTLPDFPFNKVPLERSTGFPVYGWDKIPKDDFHPVEVMAGDHWDLQDGELVKSNGLLTTGTYVAVVSGRGKTVQEANAQAYAHLDRLEIPNSPMYRTDIGQKVEGYLKRLRPLGLVDGWRW